MDIKTSITEDHLNTALSSCASNGFIVTKLEQVLQEPCCLFYKEMVYKDVERNGAQILNQLFPHNIFTKKTLSKLTRNCKGKGLEENACVFGVEVYALGTQSYRACPMIRIQIDDE